MTQSFHSTRRNFLMRFCQGAALLPVGLRRLTFPWLFAFDAGVSSSPANFQLHPHYRSPLPLDPIFLKVKAGSDQFITEKYAQEVDEIFAKWSKALLRSPAEVTPINTILAADFSAPSLRPSNSRLVRSGQIEVRENSFAEAIIKKDAFVEELTSVLGHFSKLEIAEFQVTRIRDRGAGAPAGSREGDPALAAGAKQSASDLQTRLRYDLVGESANSYREQRVGYWDLTWNRTAQGELRLLNWRPLRETESRSASPVYVDVTALALAANPSYEAQLLKGTDYWRTVLDAASGIDIYGHNGVSVGDIDNDGFDDLYICQPAGLPNRLFRNRGDGTFEDITESAGVGVLENTACALFVDINNDGLQDLIVVRANGPMLFLNQGGGKFRQKPDAFRFAAPPQGTFTGAAVADYDRDGWLDIYFCLYVYYQGTEQYKYPSPYFDAENGPPNFMMRNNRDGTFRDVTRETGLDKNNTRYSFCCGWTDFNSDGWPDLYVVNDFGRKNLYRNNRNGTFTDVATELDVQDVGAGMGLSWFDYDNDGAPDLYVADMWTAAGERITTQEIFRKDSPPEIRALYQKHAMGNSLFRNRHGAALPSKSEVPVPPEVKDFSVGSSSKAQVEPPVTEAFQNTTEAAGVGLGRWAWSCDAWDFDHDGFADLYITNGMVSGPSGEDLNSFFWRQVVAYSPDEARPSHDYEQGWNAINELIRADGTWSGYERNVFYANNRDGTFSDISGVIGLDFVEDGRAFALADFDHDGRQELVLKNRNNPQLRLLKNVMEKLPPSISFRLRGTKSNRDAIGASVTIEVVPASENAKPAEQAGPGGSSWRRRQTRFVQAGSGFLSQHSKEVFFGLGDAQGPVKASIRWPSGHVQELPNLPINHRIEVEEGAPQIRVKAFRPGSALFAGEELPAQPLSGETGRLATLVAGKDQVGSESRQRRYANAGSLLPEPLPTVVETWLLAPVLAPDFSLFDLAGRSYSLSSFRRKIVLLNFWVSASPDCQADLQLFTQKYSGWMQSGLHLLTVNFEENISAPANRAFPVLRASADLGGIYTIVYRYLFDRHRDLTFPTTFLINPQQEIVKLYQGRLNAEHVEHDCAHIPQTAAERLSRALPFPGMTEATDFSRNYLSYGSVFFQRGYFDQSEAAFQRAFRDDPSSAEAMYGLGSVYLNQQKMSEARDCFDRAIRLTASYPDTLPNAWNNLGLITAREGHADQAIPYFEQALRLSPDHTIALVNLASAYRQLKHWGDSRRVLERALATHPDDPEANYGMAMVYAQADDSDHAYEYLQRALQARPNYPEALNNLGILYLRTHRRDRAVASFEECIRVAPAFDQAYLNLARVYVIEEQPERARAILVALLKENPDHTLAKEMLEQLPK